MSFALPILSGIMNGASGLGDAIGRIVSSVVRTVGRVFSRGISSLTRYVDKIIEIAFRIGRTLARFFRIAVRYLITYAKLAWRYMYKFYTKFQEDPWRTLQFIGSLAIVINNGVL